MVTSLSRVRTRPQTSTAAVEKRWSGPMASVLTRSIRRSSRQRPCKGGRSPGAGPHREVPGKWRKIQHRRPRCSCQDGSDGRASHWVTARRRPLPPRRYPVASRQSRRCRGGSTFARLLRLRLSPQRRDRGGDDRRPAPASRPSLQGGGRLPLKCVVMSQLVTRR